jgi:hypothetical protein
MSTIMPPSLRRTAISTSQASGNRSSPERVAESH